MIELLEQLRQLFDNYRLYEMSQPRSKVRNNVQNLSSQIIEHLIKIVLYGGEERLTLHHWCHEVNNWFDQCRRNKIKQIRKDRFPNADELLTWLTDYYKNGSDIEGIRFNLEKEYMYQGHKSRKQFSDDVVYERVYNILVDVCPLVAAMENTDDAVQEIVERNIL